MAAADWIQIGVLLVLTVTMVAAFLQIKAQNKLLKAQILGQRMETYWKTYEPVTDAQAAEVDYYPDDYMDPAVYAQRYKGNVPELKKYIGILTIYEYLAFSYNLQDLGIPDSLGADWIKRWAGDLCRHAEFRDVHEWHRSYYPEFAKVVDALLQQGRPRNP